MRKVIKKVAPRKAANTLPKKANGGKTGTKSVASAGARKATTVAGNKAISSLNNQGKPGSTKKIMKGVEYDSKGRVVTKYDVSSEKGNRKQYDTDGLGSVHSSTYNPTKGVAVRSSMDTTGFSAGKRNFVKETKVETVKNGKVTTGSKSKTTVPRSSVVSTLKKMQSFRKGGKKR